MYGCSFSSEGHFHKFVMTIKNHYFDKLSSRKTVKVKVGVGVGVWVKVDLAGNKVSASAGLAGAQPERITRNATVHQ